jgi:hypothetical protein
LLPEVVRSGVALVDAACVGVGVLARVGHYDSSELLAPLGGTIVVATLLALLPGRRAAPTARTIAAVVGSSAPPVGRILGRCTMMLRLNHFDGTPRQFVHVDPHTPTATWPIAGSRVIVELVRSRKPKVVVLWHLGVVYPQADELAEESVPGNALAIPGTLDDGDLLALPRLELVEMIATNEPGHLARRYLFPTEKFRGEWRRHWIRLVKDLAVGLALSLLILSGYRAQVGGVVVDLHELRTADVSAYGVQFADLVSQGFWLIWVIWRGLTWMNNRLVLTNRRVMLISGLFWRRVASVPLAKAADILHTKSPLGTMLGYGAFRFNNVPVLRPLWRVADLPRPRDLYLQIVGETFEPEAAEARGLPVLMEDDAGLDELVAAQFIG